MGIPFAYLHQPLVGLQKLSNKECFHVFLLPYYSETYTERRQPKSLNRVGTNLILFNNVMNNKNKNVVRARLRTATQAMAILAVILVTFIACSKKDDVSNKDLIGTWVYESSTLDGIPEVDKPSEGYIDKPLENCGVKNSYVFTANQVTYIYASKYYGPDKVLYKCEIKYNKGTYSISGNTISIIGEKGNGFSATFSISGNKLIFTRTVKDDDGKTHTATATFVKQ